MIVFGGCCTIMRLPQPAFTAQRPSKFKFWTMAACPGGLGSLFVPLFVLTASLGCFPREVTVISWLDRKVCFEHGFASSPTHRRQKAPIPIVCSVCFSLACTDKELRNLASRLKDWFGALHEDANRVIKPTSSNTAQGSKAILLLLIYFILNITFPQFIRQWFRVSNVIWGWETPTTLNIYFMSQSQKSWIKKCLV